MTVSEELRERVGVLRNLHFQEANGRLKSLLAWMDSQPPIQSILAVVRRKADGLAIIKQGNSHHAPPANTPEEIAAVGLALMEACHKAHLATICLNHGIGPPYRTNAVQAYVDSALDRYIGPLLGQVRRELDRADADDAPARIVDRKFDELLLGRAFSERFPVTHQLLSRIATEFTRSDAPWQNIGNSCRQALVEFCTECGALLNIRPPDQTKRGDVKAIMRCLVQKLYSNGRFGDALETLVASTWDYAQTLSHRSATTREEARRLYLWTGLVIDEIANLVEANVQLRTASSFAT